MLTNSFSVFGTPEINQKPRVIATTDGELDDRSTMVRFLMYASDFDIEGIVQVNGVQKDGHSKDKWIEALIDKYDEVLPNLLIHNSEYPSKKYLLSVLKVGNENRNDLGKAPNLLSDSEGAQLIMNVLMDDDPRPVHILAWGGANTQANALWQIKEKYPDKWADAAAKARLYCIWYQDGGGDWIEKNLPEVQIFEAGAPEHDGSWRYVWDYMSVDMRYKKRMSANPKELQVVMDSLWLYDNIKSGHGSLTAAYPQDYTSEGDTPSFMPCVDNGLKQYTDYTLGGWGGRSIYEMKGKNHLIDGADDNNGKDDLHYTFQRWLPAVQNDWASRADWCVAKTFKDANHQPVINITGDLVREVMPGHTVTLDASGSTDPDSNKLSFKWWHYYEADNATSKLTINNDTSINNASFIVPDEPGKQIHVILEVTDDGEPALTRYERIIFNLPKAVVPDSLKPQRVIISSDIGGTDPDDFQSMVHLFLYADTFDIEGIISSPFGNGRAEHILEVIAEYEKDYPNILTYSSKYPTPDSLRKITKQGLIEEASPLGYSSSSEGSNWIIECAKRDDSRPLNVLVWGGIEDVAQALHDAPDILPKLRVYWIGGPNKKWSVNAFQYLVEHFPDLWIIESNATYRGWFTGGNQSGEWSNSGFVKTHVKNFGALGSYFNSKKTEVKMGDTPSLMRLFHGTPDDPSQPSWGGQFVRAWERPHKVFDRITSDQDSIEQFGVMELLLKFDTTTVTNPYATLKIDRDIKGMVQNDTVRLLFSPKNASSWSYTISSNIPALTNLKGKIISTMTPASNKDKPSPLYANWWTDDPSPKYIESGNIGAKTVNQWRVDFLTDFANRMSRCYALNTTFKINVVAENGTVTRSILDSIYMPGTQVTLTAEPDSGYKFTGWEGDATGSISKVSFIMNSDKNIIATFTPTTSIESMSNYNISVFPTCIKDFVSVSVTSQPNSQKLIELFDISGKSIRNYRIETGQEKILINTDALKPDVYYIRVSYDSVIYNQKLIKY